MKQTKWNQPHEYETVGAIDFRGEVLCHCGLPPDSGLHKQKHQDQTKPKASEWESTFELLLNYHIPDKEGIPMVMNHVKNLLDQQKQKMREILTANKFKRIDNDTTWYLNYDDIIKKLEEYEKED